MRRRSRRRSPVAISQHSASTASRRLFRPSTRHRPAGTPLSCRARSTSPARTGSVTAARRPPPGLRRRPAVLRAFAEVGATPKRAWATAGSSAAAMPSMTRLRSSLVGIALTHSIFASPKRSRLRSSGRVTDAAGATRNTVQPTLTPAPTEPRWRYPSRSDPAPPRVAPARTHARADSGCGCRRWRPGSGMNHPMSYAGRDRGTPR